ncbi:MAG: cytochrome c family protein [Firmicutes bacterium]|nr:cytochrome c family protein [Bacillota bacterium]
MEGICQTCHSGITDTYADSIHFTVQGMQKALVNFSHSGDLAEEPGLKKAFDDNCYKCHATCGSCHVSRPKAYSGGLHSQHTFTKQPPMDDSCYGCHGARNAGEYMGKVGYATDIHYTNEMHCVDCHSVSNFHGSGVQEQNMYEVDLPECIDCHDKVYTDTNVEAHQAHSPDTMSCQVCHASANNNCYDCHATPNSDGSVSGTSDSRIMFKIGINPNRTEDRPYQYITLRHIPTTADTFEPLDGEIPNYDLYPNWKYSPTHNIQRNTIQNESCDSCHGNQYIFLREEDLRDNDSKANQQLVVPKIP